MKRTIAQEQRLEKQFSEYAKGEKVNTDCTSETGDVYIFTTELGMYRIAEKMRSMSNFSYGFSEAFGFYCKLELPNWSPAIN